MLIRLSLDLPFLAIFAHFLFHQDTSSQISPFPHHPEIVLSQFFVKCIFSVYMIACFEPNLTTITFPLLVFLELLLASRFKHFAECSLNLRLDLSAFSTCSYSHTVGRVCRTVRPSLQPPGASRCAVGSAPEAPVIVVIQNAPFTSLRCWISCFLDLGS